MSPKTLIIDGRAIITRIKSNLFQLSDQYFANPCSRIFTIASNKNSSVNRQSMIIRVPSWLEMKPLTNIMPVLMRTNTSITLSFVKRRFTQSIYKYRLAASISCFLKLYMSSIFSIVSICSFLLSSTNPIRLLLRLLKCNRQIGRRLLSSAKIAKYDCESR